MVRTVVTLYHSSYTDVTHTLKMGAACYSETLIINQKISHGCRIQATVTQTWIIFLPSINRSPLNWWKMVLTVRWVVTRECECVRRWRPVWWQVNWRIINISIFINALTYGNSAGDPKYRVPVVDPLLIEELSLSQGTSNFGLSFTATNLTVRGLKNVQVKDIR